MKKTLFYAAILLFSIHAAQAQLTISPSPFNINSGIVTVTYGASGDFSLYNPNGETTLYLYTGLETDGTVNTWEYHDVWGDVGSLVPLVWNPAQSAFVGSFDIGGRNYYSTQTMATGPLPIGTNVNNWYFIIRNFNGNQTTNLIGTDYGFGLSVLANQSYELSGFQLYVSKGVLSATVTGNGVLKIFSVTGQEVRSFPFENASGRSEIPLQLKTGCVYIGLLECNGKTQSIKFLN